VAGCPSSPAGEAALSAINVMQLRWPGSAHAARRQSDAPLSGGVRPWPYGLELGAACVPLLAQRWEEGWALPLAEWRERLGIAAVVARSPFGASGGG
jgi:ubiquinone biosynthesis protein COQ4